ncbi:3,4-dihydroxy-2-butanone 4-phosphate synthase [Candidatus Endolissoclinum faulkneri L2]|uniref:3,4-dihydroxy-2-butanone 4-phosphate synthase n=1 Tax=Candidatus Endolissoclinum faulkneri L2 TaxID=1193729 RepID=K7YR74_9PROT|nr:3,4-dihydroxy-2-butanone-4-phosphate synthase [Candidatus Endolissoclinum faulkneri]AFX99029.1 3,4-dihydroxy-2-butanone 4-phosphate synthase [Candidatus Endolissoclinum faulkneri L2]
MSNQRILYPLKVYPGVLSTIDEVVEEARSGRMFILVDDENRENEGDLCIMAEMATPETINFMAKYARGLICLSLTRERIDKLGLPLMSSRNETRHETAFTVSIEARNGVTTGISAHDRAHTIRVAIDVKLGREDIVTPGHVLPLMAREGGTLVRAGHTEAVVDIARMAGLNPSGVICEIMNDDGTMARLPDLMRFAQFHNMKIATIADLIAYRRRTESIVDRAVETSLHSKFGGDWRMIVYTNKVSYAEHVVLVKGDITTKAPVLVRMHALNVLEDVLGHDSGNRGGILGSAMTIIGDVGRGVVVLIREPSATSLSDLVHDKLRAEAEGRTANEELRDYGVGAQILLDLDINYMILLSNTKRTIIGLDGYGLKVVEQRSITIDK